MKTFFSFYFALTAFVYAQTNQLYVTEDVSTNFERFVEITNQIAAANDFNESRPAIDDPEGNWGKEIEGCQLSIRLSKKVFAEDESIYADILFRNVSGKPKHFLYFDPDDENLYLKLEKEIEVKNENGGIVFEGKIVNEIRERNSPGKVWRPVVQVGKQYKSIVNLTNIFDLTPGKYKLQVQRWVINYDRDYATNIDSGLVSFEIIEKSGRKLK